jgi:hypothetical protein
MFTLVFGWCMVIRATKPLLLSISWGCYVGTDAAAIIADFFFD